jgi:hypothetical protein
MSTFTKNLWLLLIGYYAVSPVLVPEITGGLPAFWTPGFAVYVYIPVLVGTVGILTVQHLVDRIPFWCLLLAAIPGAEVAYTWGDLFFP